MLCKAICSAFYITLHICTSFSPIIPYSVRIVNNIRTRLSSIFFLFSMFFYINNL